AHAAVLEQLARSDRHHLRFDRLFLRGVRDVKSAGSTLLLRQPLDQNPVMKWPNFHCHPPLPSAVFLLSLVLGAASGAPYPSRYQPEPLSRNVEPEISRSTVWRLQRGHL